MYSIVNSTVSIAGWLPFTAEERETARKHAVRTQTQVELFAEAVRRGARSEVRRLAENIIRSPSAKKSSLIRGYGGTGLGHPQFREPNLDIGSPAHRARTSLPTFQQIEARAMALRITSVLDEPAWSWKEPKLRDGWRPIIAFGPLHEALHTICGDMLDAALPDNPREYNRRRRGDERMTQDIAAAIRERGFDHVVSIDIRNCFGSVRKEDVARLSPLPRWMIDAIVLLNDQKRVVPIHTDRYPSVVADEVARAGLPQGASTSSLIMSRAILGPLLAATPFANETYLFVDNVFVVARGRVEAEVRLDTLRSLLANSAGGPLTIGTEGITHCREKINLLKYALQPIPTRYGGGMRIVPSQQSFRNFSLRAQRKMLDVPRSQEERVLQQYMREWLDAFPLWRRNVTTDQYMRSHALMAFVLLGIRPA